ncbi:MAG: MFS transporter [Desulfobacteraceae bacterium]|jgi:MFS family permease
MTKPTKIFNKNYFLLWQGQLVSLFGSQAYAIAMMFWIKHQTGSATLMGLIMMVAQIPGVVLGPISGVVVDRYSRWKIIVGCDLIRGVVTIALAALVYFCPDRHSLIIASLFTVGLIASSAAAFFNPATGAVTPDLVPIEKLAAANSMQAFSAQAANSIGLGVGGILFRIFGAPILFFIDGITFIFSAISEMFITIPQQFPEEKADVKSSFRRMIDDAKEGFHYIWQNKGLRDLIFIAALVTFFMVPGMVLMPFFVEGYLIATPDWFGFITAGLTVGNMIGFAIAAGVKVSGSVRGKMNLAAIILACVFMTLLGFIRVKELALINMFLTGIVQGFSGVNIMTILQLTTPPWIRGRVFGVMGSLNGALAPIAMGLTGAIADLLNQNVPLVLIAGGAISALLCIILVFRKELRKFMAFEPEPENEAEVNPVEVAESV